MPLSYMLLSVMLITTATPNHVSVTDDILTHANLNHDALTAMLVLSLMLLTQYDANLSRTS